MPFSREREKINRIDGQLVSLLNRRALLAKKIGEIKKSKGLDVYDPSREQEILASLARENPGPFPAASLDAVFREIFAASRHL